MNNLLEITLTQLTLTIISFTIVVAMQTALLQWLWNEQYGEKKAEKLLGITYIGTFAVDAVSLMLVVIFGFWPCLFYSFFLTIIVWGIKAAVREAKKSHWNFEAQSWKSWILPSLSQGVIKLRRHQRWGFTRKEAYVESYTSRIDSLLRIIAWGAIGAMLLNSLRRGGFR